LIELHREWIALAIIAVLLAAGIPLMIIQVQRRRRARLRRRGIKTGGH